jgi:hypothetical protein
MRTILGPALLAASISMTVAAPTFGDDKVTGQTYVRHDGGSDPAIAECNNSSTNPTPVAPSGGDVDPNDGGSRHHENEPYAVVDPTDPDTIVTGWNGQCTIDLGGVQWQGVGYSRDGGATWRNSLVPGYPQDSSAEGRASPLFGRHDRALDPVAAFDRTGRLYVGGIGLKQDERSRSIHGDVWVARYGTNPPACARATRPSCPGFPVDYEGAVIVGQGTPSPQIQHDKPGLEVDRTGGPHDGNVYFCWTRFTGSGQQKLFFSRSTDRGRTFSRPSSISHRSDEGLHSALFCDIAIEHDGDVYVTWHTFDDPASKTSSALAFARSNDGGASFGRAKRIRDFVPYYPFDGDRVCGDGESLCPADFVFHRTIPGPRVAADQTGTLPGVYLVYNEIKPGSTVASQTSYRSAGDPFFQLGRPDLVGQSLAFVVRSLSNGASWEGPVAVDPAPRGHQFFPDVDAFRGKLGIVWQDSRTDPAYSVQRPLGNAYVPFGGRNRAVSSGTNIVNTFFIRLTSAAPLTLSPSTKISSVGHQSQLEMYESRDRPFHGDYNWISLAPRGGSVFAYMTWTDNRDVVRGDDPRETDPNGDGNPADGFDDNFDVKMCLAFDPVAGTYSSNRCANAGGFDQNIYGGRVTLP